jgi:uncharacterized membrane protein HdeD (DUF308 family)
MPSDAATLQDLEDIDVDQDEGDTKAGDGKGMRLSADRFAAKWGGFVALGVVMILAGIVALGETMLVRLASVIFIGGALQVSGILQIIHAAANRDWDAFLIALLCGVLYVVGGFLIMQEPVQGSVMFTILLPAVLATGGGLRIAVALRHGEVTGGWVLLLSGLISFAFAAMLFLTLPWSGLWGLGALIGIELLVQGFSWISVGFALRHTRRPA